MNMPSGLAAKNFLVGLTGGIGSGKSTVATMFEHLGVRIIDTDQLSRSLTQADGAAIPAIQASFGADFLNQDGALDRSKMRERVFSEPAAKLQLEAILHPLILRQVQQQAATPTSAPYSMIVIPLLFENRSYHNLLRRTLVVDCPEASQLARTMQRSQLDEASVRAIMAQQLPRELRNAQADDLIRNDGDLSALTAQVELLHKRYLILAAGSN